ncbi:hypothetical protein A2454_05675 [Candidatus Peribacteria bacterium RIFOXYC2_FULL_55_14]|nr:MAG: hypothetical protein UY85_C0032G0011 [Candidatus Peribacteria bacterium GW2011_GWB1_54_5]KKW38566.1 MAG: hypothetical protein UY87_C0068G0003 [Candidatus Peribacteria bacterium GW2011_GWC2_54_8]KKW43347.1 MAG: hypothetical protein UY90_C0028G0011 [Candidatus Peregrinibacteria bacterium GW2011_GWA2_54_9]OGJ72051.1 MAG: hypothetical protein A2198_04230 [Candidatus Peribacteria bacterium RIFOXYA1_FULL_56_14]OGJ74064.1 MAG: hypothetical protein A2217_00250 [Candidatus Peribacteria bacterium
MQELVNLFGLLLPPNEIRPIFSEIKYGMTDKLLRKFFSGWKEGADQTALINRKMSTTLALDKGGFTFVLEDPKYLKDFLKQSEQIYTLYTQMLETQLIRKIGFERIGVVGLDVSFEDAVCKLREKFFLKKPEVTFLSSKFSDFLFSVNLIKNDFLCEYNAGVARRGEVCSMLEDRTEFLRAEDLPETSLFFDLNVSKKNSTSEMGRKILKDAESLSKNLFNEFFEFSLTDVNKDK